ncbi:MAG: ABC transporter ATP-binding protein [Ezakiella sp.]|nr:ABC transporter ATP-binding protein [Bacillota bacterium]MDY3946440.1 ABC transporter ATP-binding protein [Ezakiella sp.]
METLIKLVDLYKIYRMGEEKIRALNGVSLEIYDKECLCLIGPSGSGKSTLLNLCAGLEKPTKGEIIVGGIHLEKLNEVDMTKFRQLNVGFVFQSYNLIPTLSALENVGLGLTFKGVKKSKRDKMARDILNEVGLGSRLHHKPSEMSGGQQQRVSIARAFVDKPRIIFADEPTGNLDSKTSMEVMELMTSMVREAGSTLIIVTHDVETAVYSDRIVHFRDGKIEKIEKITPLPIEHKEAPIEEEKVN